MPVFLYTKKDICYALLYNQFTTKIMLKQAMQMSQNYFILDVLGIKDPNINLNFKNKLATGLK